MNLNALNIDIVIFIGFLIVNLIVGLSNSRKIKTISDYALGGRNFTTTALVSTIVATCITGSGFFIVLTKTYSDGLYYLIPNIFIIMQMFITVYFLIPRMGEFLGNLSVAEALGNIYGKEIQFISAICGILKMIGGIAVQFKVFGNIFHYFLGMDPTFSIFLASTIVILYSSLGGIKAVTYTDIIQFVTFGFVIPLIGIILWNHISNTGISFSAAIENSHFDYKQVLDFSNPKFWSMITLIFYFIMPSTDPTSFQRISMGRNIVQVKKAWLIAAILFGIIIISTCWIPFLIKILEPNLQANQIVNYLIENYTFTGLKGLMIIGIAAMAMSTADSRINAASVLFANDIGKVLNIKINELVLSRVFSILLGIVAIYLALSKTDLLSIVMTSASFYLPIVTVPLLLAIFGFRSTKKSVLIAMISGFAVVLVGNLFEIDADIIIIGMLVNLVTFLASHYLLKQSGGWVGIKDREYLDYAKKLRKRKRAAFLNSMREFNLITFCKKTAPKDELGYMYLGIYFIMYSFTTMYATQAELLKEGSLILTVYQIMMVTGVVTAMYPIWPPRIKYELIMQLSWNVIIFYMLIFFSAFFVMVSDFGQLQFAVFILNILIVTILIGWKLGLSMLAIGFYLSSIFYKYYAGIASLDFSIGSSQFMFIYTMIFAGTALLIFFKPKQEIHELTKKKNEHLSGRISLQEQELRESATLKSEFIRNVTHEYHAPMTGISSMAQILVENYDQLTDEQRKVAAKTLLDSSLRLETFDKNISSLSKLSKGKLDFKLEAVNLSELVEDSVTMCRKLYEKKPEDKEWILDIEEEITVNIDKYYFKQSIENLVVNAIAHCPKGKIEITLEKDKYGVHFSIRDEGVGIPTDELYDIFAEFTTSSRTRTPSGGRGIGLTLCKKVIELHGGTIKAQSNGKKGAKFTFTLPGDVKKQM